MNGGATQTPKKDDYAEAAKMILNMAQEMFKKESQSKQNGPMPLLNVEEKGKNMDSDNMVSEKVENVFVSHREKSSASDDLFLCF